MLKACHYHIINYIKPMIIIAISGGSASGKTLLCKELTKNIIDRGLSVSVMSEDNFYFGLPDGIHPDEYNFDCPDSIDFKSMMNAIIKLKSGVDSVEIPVYDFTIHKTTGTTLVKSSDVLIVEGILLFSEEELNKIMDLKIYVNASPEIRFARRIKRDITERGRDLDYVISTYLTFVKPSYEKYIAPTMYQSDIIVNNDSNNGDHNLSSKIHMIVALVYEKSLSSKFGI